MSDPCTPVVYSNVMECCAGTTYALLANPVRGWWPGTIGAGGICLPPRGVTCKPVGMGDQVGMFSESEATR